MNLSIFSCLESEELEKVLSLLLTQEAHEGFSLSLLVHKHYCTWPIFSHFLCGLNFSLRLRGWNLTTLQNMAF